MKLKKLHDGKFAVEFTTENGSEASLPLPCKTEVEAEMFMRDAKLREIANASKAHRLTAEVVSLITANRSITVRDVIAEWDDWMASAAKSDRTRHNNTQVARQWASECNLGDRTIASIDLPEIDLWVNEPDGKTKAGTRNMRLAAIRALFRFASIKRYVLSDPSRLATVNLRKLPHALKETKHKPVFTDDEIDFLVAHAGEGVEPPSITPGFFKAALILGRDLGLRISDIASLEWDSIDIARKTAVIWVNKTGERVEVPVSKRAMELILGTEQRNTRFLFPNEQEILSNPQRRALLSVSFSRFLSSHGFGKGYGFHSLRASYATTMALKGATVQEIAAALGHSKESRSVTLDYIRDKDSAVIGRR